jgi:hypothetical protein
MMNRPSPEYEYRTKPKFPIEGWILLASIGLALGLAKIFKLF